MATGSGGGAPTLGKAYITIIPTTKNARKEMSKALIPELEASGKEGGEAVSKGIGSVLSSGVGKIAGLAKGLITSGAADAIQSFTSDVVGAYSTFEQLSGGVEKIFDEMDTSKIFTDAQNAYKDLGISANEYLEAMTSIGATFAATLGDEEGYNVARQGMKAVSDLASGTGKDLGQLTEKYQLITRSASSYLSIADQFAGILPQSTEGFLEQAKAAGLIDQSYKKITEIPLPEYQKAVTAMIEQGVGSMGLLGNTAAEAEQTLEGSTNMMKASWENLLTSFGTGSTEEISKAFSATLDSAMTWGRLMLDRIGILGQGVLDALPGLWNSIVERVPQLFDWIRGVIRDRISRIGELAGAIGAQVGPLVSQVVQFVADAAKELWPRMGEFIRGALGLVVDTLKSFDWVGTGSAIIDAIMSVDWLGLAVNILTAVIDAVGDIGGFVIDTLMSVDWLGAGQRIIDTLMSVDWIGLGTRIVESVAGALGDIVSRVVGPDVFSGIKDAAGQLAGPVEEALAPVGDKIKGIFGDAATKAQEALPQIIAWVTDLGAKISEFLASVPWEQVGAFLGDIVAKIADIGASATAIFVDLLGGIVWPLVEQVWGFISDVLLPGLMQFMGPLGDFFVLVGDFLASAFDWISKIVGGLTDFLKPAIELIFSFLNPLISGLLSALASLFGMVVDTLSSLWEHVKPFVDKVVEIVSMVFSKIGAFLEENKGWISDILGWLGNVLGSFFSILTNTIGGIFSFIGGLIGGVLDHVTLVIDGIGKVIGGIIDVVRGVFDVVIGVITGDFDKAKAGVEKIFAGFGQAVQGFADVLTAPFKTAFKAIKDLWNNTLGGFQFTAPDWVPVIGGQTIGIPKLAEGGTLAVAGTVMVGEEGPELLTLPRGATVTPLDDADAASGDTYMVEVGDVNLSDDDDVRRVTREYLEYLATRANRRRVPVASV